MDVGAIIAGALGGTAQAVGQIADANIKVMNNSVLHRRRMTDAMDRKLVNLMALPKVSGDVLPPAEAPMPEPIVPPTLSAAAGITPVRDPSKLTPQDRLYLQMQTIRSRNMEQRHASERAENEALQQKLHARLWPGLVPDQ